MAFPGTDNLRKTQVALEYAYRRADKEPACSVFWVHADDETTFVSGYKTIAKSLKIPTDLDGDELLTAVRDAIEALGPYVLVLDNADNLTVFGIGRDHAAGGENMAGKMARNLFGFVPRHSGTVLWTSRDKRIGGSLVGAKRAINVARMTDTEAMALLEMIGNRNISEGELDDAAQLLAELDWLPLAVSQAAAYMRRTATPIGGYLPSLRRRMKRWEVLSTTEFDRHRRWDVSNNVIQTWDISIEHLRLENQMAYDILHSLAFVDNQNIPFELVAKAAEIMGGPTRNEETASAKSACSRDQDEGEDGNDDVLAAIVLLQDFSFLRRRTSGERRQAYDMHKLVQEAAQYSLSQEKRRKDELHFSEIALRAAASLFPERRRELWGECERYLQHAQRAAAWARLCEGELEAAALLTRVSNYLYDRGRWREKEPVDERAYEYRRKALGEKHPDTIGSMADLAVVYHSQGRYNKGEKISVEVLALRREVLGEKHPDTIWSMADLGFTCYARGRYDEARKIYIEVLALKRDVLGEKHPDTIRSIADLGLISYIQGRFEEAEKIATEVLALRRDILGDKHPGTIHSIADLGSIYHAQGRYDEAGRIQVEVLALRQEVLGEKHPDTIWSMADLGSIYHAQERYDEAGKIKVEVLALRQDVLGEKHPDTIRSMAALVSTYHAQGRFDKSGKIATEALALRRDVLGDKHPDTIESMADIALTYDQQGRYDEAEKIKAEVLALRRDVLGEKHPNTLQAMHNLAVSWNNLQRCPEALAMMQECFQLQCEALGETHPFTCGSLHYLDSWGLGREKGSRMSRMFGRMAYRVKPRFYSNR